MKVGDLVKNRIHAGLYGKVGLVVEEEKYEGKVGTWVWYFNDPTWRWYSYDEQRSVEVLSESR